jgi:hypothetical protein
MRTDEASAGVAEARNDEWAADPLGYRDIAEKMVMPEPYALNAGGLCGV